MPAVTVSSLLLRLVLIATFVLNGAWSAFASTNMGAMALGHLEAHDMTVHSAPAEDVDCAHHPGVSGSEALAASPVDGDGHAQGDHPAPDGCTSSACQCACMHACASTLPAYVSVSVQPSLGRHLSLLSPGHPAPALPHLIRPPIG